MSIPTETHDLTIVLDDTTSLVVEFTNIGQCWNAYQALNHADNVADITMSKTTSS